MEPCNPRPTQHYEIIPPTTSAATVEDLPYQVILSYQCQQEAQLQLSPPLLTSSQPDADLYDLVRQEQEQELQELPIAQKRAFEPSPPVQPSKYWRSDNVSPDVPPTLENSPPLTIEDQERQAQQQQQQQQQ